PFLQDRLQPVPVSAAKQAERRQRLAHLFSELKSPDLKVQEKAKAELRKSGPLALRAVREALVKEVDLSHQRRFELVLDYLQKHKPSPAAVRFVRVLTVLELINSPRAREAIEALCRGDDDSPLTQHARAAAARMKRASP